MSKNAITPMEMQVFISADITEDFKSIKASGFDGPLSFLRIVNTMDEPVFISFDGQDNHEYIPASDSIDINNQACATSSNGISLFRNNAEVYVKRAGGVPATGSVIVSGFYL